MTPESIPGKLVPEDELELLRIEPYHEGPAYDHHEVFLTGLAEAA